MTSYRCKRQSSFSFTCADPKDKKASRVVGSDCSNNIQDLRCCDGSPVIKVETYTGGAPGISGTLVSEANLELCSKLQFWTEGTGVINVSQGSAQVQLETANLLTGSGDPIDPPPAPSRVFGYLDVTSSTFWVWNGSWIKITELDILTTQGDLLTVDSSGNAVRLPRGNTNQMLISNTNADLEWVDQQVIPPPELDVLTNRGDLVTKDLNLDVVRLPIGTPGQILTAGPNGDPTWVDPPPKGEEIIIYDRNISPLILTRPECGKAIVIPDENTASDREVLAWFNAQNGDEITIFCRGSVDILNLESLDICLLPGTTSHTVELGNAGIGVTKTWTFLNSNTNMFNNSVPGVPVSTTNGPGWYLKSEGTFGQII